MSARPPAKRPGSTLTVRRVLALAGIAAALHLGFDAVAYRLPWASPPYLRLTDAPEAFRSISPVAVSVATSIVAAIIDLIAVAAVEPRHRRARVLAPIVTAFWLFSATLTWAVWLSTPWTTALVAVLCGVPRGAVIGWCLARALAGVNASTAGAA